ncbi:MAG TPA: GlsB/YeaQ/YmgE family stress response membrane protein, partial [Actinomycetota bacterium]|nr:GlsB/YeaQ/YmgE family stress response membrane protein [Actinomycetota bacterium]
VWLVIVGLVVGFLARLLMPGSDPMGVLGTIVIGIVGVIGGYYVAAAVFPDNDGIPWIASVLVAMALLWVYRRMTYGRGTAV